MAQPTAQNTVHGRFYRTLYFQVLVGIALGVLLGVLYPHTAEMMKPLADGFIRLVKMLIAPIIFCTVVIGIAGMEKLRGVGKTGGLALLYFEVLTTVALIIGLIVVNVAKPGAGLNIDAASLDTHDVAQYSKPGELPGVVDFILNIIPSTFFDAFAKGDVLQVLLLSVLFGFALHSAGGRSSIVFDLIDKTSHVLFAIVAVVIRLAPLGAFGAMAFAIGKFGTHALFALGKLLACFYVTCLLFILGVLGGIARWHGFSIIRFVRYIGDELFIVLGTSSSESVLPRMLAKMEALGVQKSAVGLIIPAGYSFNLDGTCIYLTLAAVFIAQATNTPLDLTHQLALLAVLLLASKGAAGVTGSGFIVLAASLSSVGHVPVAGLALIFAIDRFMSEARALTNLIGNGVATIVVGKWVRQVDEEKLSATLTPQVRRAAAESGPDTAAP